MVDKGSPSVRVLHVVTNMDAGGIENMIMSLYHNIDRNKVQFDFLIHRNSKGFFDDDIRSMGGIIHIVTRLRFVRFFTYMNELIRFFQENPEYKIVHSHISVISFFVLLAAKIAKVPIRVAHSHESHNGIQGIRILRIPIIWILKKLINLPITHRFACAQDAGVWLFGREKEFHIIKNSISLKKFLFNAKISIELKNEMGLSNAIVIGHVGNFTKPKNYPFILNVFKEISKKRSDARLLLVGDFNRNLEFYKLVRESKIRDQIIFAGLRKDVYNLYMVMDIFLFPSINEGLPVTLIEAQASGLKIFAADSITKEVAITDRICFLSLNKRPDFWAEQILNALPYDRIDTSEIIKEKGYDIVENAKKLEEFYLKQINRID